MYAIGGSEPLTDTVQMADINPDGTLGSWSSATSLPLPLAGLDAVVVDGEIYVIAGHTTGGPVVSDVFAAHIQPDGSLGAWATETSLPASRNEHSAVLHNQIISRYQHNRSV